MTVYNQHTYGSVMVPAHLTVSKEMDHLHVAKGRQPGDRSPIAIKCPDCEPYLLREGWVRSPALVPPTDVDEDDDDEEVNSIRR